ncbi:Nicotinamide riboside kinase 1, partial [Toxocara canis]
MNADRVNLNRSSLQHSEPSKVSSSYGALSGTIIGIAGCTNAGKTTIANSLLLKLRANGQTAVVVGQDEFYYTKDAVRRIWKEDDSSICFHDHDSPQSVDEQRFVEAVLNAVDANNYVIVEGNMLTELRTVCSLANRIFFLTLDRKTCLERRIQRIDYDPPDEPGYFEQVVWPAYQQHLSNALEMARETDRLTFVDVVNMDTTNEDIIDK